MACSYRSPLRLYAALSIALTLATPALAQQSARVAPSAQAEAAWKSKNLERFDWLLLRETDACLASNPAEKCLDLMLIVRERVSSYNYFSYELGPPSSWDPTRPTIESRPQNLERAKSIAAQAADVAAQFGGGLQLVIAETSGRAGDATDEVVTLYRALSNVLSTGEDLAVRAALAGQLHALGEIAGASALIDAVGVSEAVAANPDFDAARAIRNLRAVMAIEAGFTQLSSSIADLRALYDALLIEKGSKSLEASIAGLNLSRVHHLDGDFAGAEALQRPHLPVIAAALPDHPGHAAALAIHAETLIALERAAEAEVLLSDARKIAARHGGEAQSSVERIDLLRADALIALNRGSEAEAVLRQALSRSDTIDAGALATTRAIAKRLAEPGYISMETRTTFEPNDARRRRTRPLRIAELHLHLASTLERAGNVAQARAAAQLAFAGAPFHVPAITTLARYELTGQWLDAMPDYELRAILFGALSNLPPDHPARVDLHLLTAFATVRGASGMAFLGLPEMRKAVAVVKRRMESRAVYDTQAERELKTYSPLFMGQVQWNWMAAQQLGPAR